MMTTNHTVRLLMTIAIAAFAAPAIQPAFAATRGDCVTVVVNLPFRLPDGVIYPAGTLTLCDAGAFSPVDTLHRVFVAGSSVGVFRSRRHDAEAGSLEAPQVLFNRDGEGHLELIGYAMPTSGHVWAYRMKPQSDAFRAAAQQRPVGAGAGLAAVVATAR